MDLLDLLDVKSPAQKFLEFHRDNPHVYRCIEDAIERALEANGGRVIRTSIDYFVHYARWHGVTITTTADGDFKIANQFTPFYSRLLLERHPEWAGLFETRKSVADDATWIAEAA
jgi:hypothetical protein